MCASTINEEYVLSFNRLIASMYRKRYLQQYCEYLQYCCGMDGDGNPAGS